MKKSNFLRNSKDMLTKSFNSAKCKTSLKLASSRLKLLKNKKEAQVKQMRRELAQLLDSGQDRTARIRVEHVVREEKMMAAYDLIEIYCELIVARLPIIESQKNCPIDLKEAISSVVFASPRCGDIPELADVRKHFSTKYGKDFITAAVELRPECGVGRMLVEKLSARAPDVDTKMKILGAIAEEHGVKWDPKSVEEAEPTPPNDLLNGSGSLEKFSNIHEAPSHIEASNMRTPPHFEAPNVRTPLDHTKGPNASSNFREQNARFVSAHGGATVAAQSSDNYFEVSPSGFGNERVEVSEAFPGERNSSVSRQNWNMEFKDATSAAQAAAESAERASLAARAAAELSRVSRQHSSESRKSDVQSFEGGVAEIYDTPRRREHSGKDSATSSLPDRNERYQNERIDGDSHGKSGSEGPSKYSGSSIQESFPKASAARSSPDRNSRFWNDRTDDLQHDNQARAASHYNDSRGTLDRPQSQVSHGATGSTNNNFSFDNDKEGDRHMQNLSSKEDSSDKTIERKLSGESEAESLSSFENDITDNNNYFGEETASKVSKINSSHSYLSTTDPGAVNKNSHVAASVVFDDSGSEDDRIIKFDSDPVYDDQQAKLYFPSPERKSFGYDSTVNKLWSFDSEKSREKSHLSSEIFVETQSPQLSESVVASGDNSRPVNAVPTFDDSDGMSSDSDSELVRQPVGRSNDFQNAPKEHARNQESPRSSYMQNVPATDGKKESHSLSDKTISNDVLRHGKRDSVDFSSEDEATTKAHNDANAPALPGTQTDDGSSASVSGFEKELKFGKLTGGLKHKGYIPPPYTRSQLNNVPSSMEGDKGSPVVMSQVVTPPDSSVGVGIRKKRQDKSSSRFEDTHPASDTDSSDEELSLDTRYRQRTHTHKADNEVTTAKYAGLRGSTTYFDSDSSDSDVGHKKSPLTGRSQLASGFSRRTKASSSSSDTKPSSKFKISSEAAATYESSADRKPASNSINAETHEPRKSFKNSYSADTQEPKRPRRKSYSNETHEAPSDRRMSSEQAVVGLTSSKPTAQAKITTQEGSLKSARVEQPSSSAQAKMSEASNSNIAARAPASSGDKYSREDSMKKASHVHPKLPDYDDIAARLQSLRTNLK